MNFRLSLAGFLLCSAMVAMAADGDISSVSINADGWSAWVAIEDSGNNTNGTFASGLGTNNADTNSAKLKLQLVSMGYDSTGTAVTNENTVRTIYGTKLVRFAYPDNAFMQTTNEGGDTKFLVALSDFVYQKDSNIVATILSGLYSTNTFTNSAASDVAVANNSTQPYPKVIANWSWPGNMLVRSNTMTLRAVGFHQSAMDGKPLAALKFLITGATSGITASNIQTAMQIDSSVGDAMPFGEYVASFDISSFTDHELIRCDIIAYPWCGDSDSLLDTTLDLYTAPYPTSITNRADVNNTWSTVIAVVDATLGNDTNGRATNNSDPTLVHSSAYFATIGKAATACAATNNAFFSHNDLEGVTIYLRSSVDTFTGSSVTAGDAPYTWCEILPYPGDAVSLTNYSTARTLGTYGLHRISGITNTGGYLFYGGYFWFDDCTFNTTAASTINGQAGVWFTRCDVPTMTQGVTAYSSSKIFNLIRGCDLSGLVKPVCAEVVVGNKRLSGGAGFQIKTDTSGQPFEYGILYNNNFLSVSTAAEIILSGSSMTTSNGFVIAQNVIEGCSSSALASYSMPWTATTHATNVCLWNNVFLGAKFNLFYNDSGSAAAYRYLCSVVNNIIDDYNIKADVFTTADGARVGNWPPLYGVGYEGNLFPETGYVGAAGTFLNEFGGINSIAQSVASGVAGVTNELSYIGFVDVKSWPSGTSPTAGGGDYRVSSSSPAIGLATYILPYDIAGNARYSGGAAGAYEHQRASGQPLRRSNAVRVGGKKRFL